MARGSAGCLEQAGQTEGTEAELAQAEHGVAAVEHGGTSGHDLQLTPAACPGQAESQSLRRCTAEPDFSHLSGM